MELLLNASSIDCPVLDTVPKRHKLNKDGQVNEAETKMPYRSPLGGWVASQVAMYANVNLSADKKKELGLKARLVHA